MMIAHGGYFYYTCAASSTHTYSVLRHPEIAKILHGLRFVTNVQFWSFGALRSALVGCQICIEDETSQLTHEKCSHCIW
jgi:hypothetical protein